MILKEIFMEPIRVALQTNLAVYGQEDFYILSVAESYYIIGRRQIN